MLRLALTCLMFIFYTRVAVSQPPGNVIDNYPRVNETKEQAEARFALESAQRMEEDRIRITQQIRSINDAIRPEDLLKQFYNRPDFMVDAVIKDRRIAGRGWKMEFRDREKISVAIRDVILKRDGFLAEAKMLKEIPMELWSKVISHEVDSDQRIGELLIEALPPDELFAYVLEHHDSVASALMTNVVFKQLADLPEEYMQEAKKVRAEELKLKIASISTNAPGDKEERYVLIARLGRFLTPAQFDVILRLSGRKDEATPLLTFLESAGPEEREVYMKIFPSIKSLLSKRQK
jgi:hypothetical protein